MPMCAATVFREACSIRRSTLAVLQDVPEPTFIEFYYDHVQDHRSTKI